MHAAIEDVQHFSDGALSPWLLGGVYICSLRQFGQSCSFHAVILCSIATPPGLQKGYDGDVQWTHRRLLPVTERRYFLLQKKHVVVVGDSNIVGTPLSVLLRDAGAGTVTVCHRIAYTNIFEDRLSHGKSRQLRPNAHACLPRLPGPYSPVDATVDSIGETPRVSESAQVQVAELKQDVSRRACSPPDAARVTVVQKSDATKIVVEVRL